MDVRIKDKYWLIEGDCVVALKKIPDEKCDAMITDPPAGIKFMNKNWDDDKGGRDEWINWLKDIMAEALRCLKPGAHGLVWALPRTSHWTTMALENAGFEVRDVITHLFGTGFPKSLNISKAIDKELGAEREVIGKYQRPDGSQSRKCLQGFNPEYVNSELHQTQIQGETLLTAPVTQLAKKYDGWGTALKPASEHWILIRKPLSEKTVAKNVLKFGTGGINIDECRVKLVDAANYSANSNRTNVKSHWGNSDAKVSVEANLQGRFPANLVLSHNDDCEYVGTKEVANRGHRGKDPKDSSDKSMFGISDTNSIHYVNENGKETVSEFKCSEGCAVKMLDEQSGTLKSGGGDKGNKQNKGLFGNGKSFTAVCESSEGGASRFFYCAKASGADKNTGLDDFEAKKVNDGRQSEIDNAFQRGETKRKNTHPTVKSTKLMEYLIKLITPDNGIVLDPFMGSGSTGVSARNLNKKFIGIEKEAEYFTIAKSRLEYTNNDPEQWDPIQKVS